ncbi:6568_t:CDS:1, partial [Ambispora gerdemannii]
FNHAPIFQQRTPIDTNLRYFIKFIYLKHNQYSWQLSDISQHLLNNIDVQDINWKATLQVWNPNKGANSAFTTSFHSNIRTYFIKCINQQLP